MLRGDFFLVCRAHASPHVHNKTASHDIHCDPKGATLAVAMGHVDVIRDLAVHGILPDNSKPGAWLNSLICSTGHIEMARTLFELGVFKADEDVQSEWMMDQLKKRGIIPL